MFLHGKKSFILKISLLKKTLFTAKDIYEIYENIFHIYIYIYIYFYAENVWVTNKKSFLNICSFSKKNFLIIKNIFIKTSFWTQQSGP